MPETYGIPEPEPTTIESFEKLAAGYIAGQGIVRRVILYAVTAALIISPVAPLAIVPLVLLLATDGGLA